MVTFSRIYKTEVLDPTTNRLRWDYRSYGSAGGRMVGGVSGATEKECQEQIDYALANPDEWTSKLMRNWKP
jgi:hypothetical protein